jgi:hypothetical protein
MAALPEYGAASTAALLVEAMMRDPGCAALLAAAVRQRDRHGGTPLLQAAYHGSRELVAKLVEAGADRDAVSDNGTTPLMAAVRRGHVQLVPLLATPSNINLLACSGTPAAYHSSPLHAAAAGGDKPMVEALLAAGADVHTPDSHGCSALGVAARHSRNEVVLLLLAALAKGWGDQEEKARGMALVAPAVVELTGGLGAMPVCAQLLGAVLDVLGPGVAEEVCLQAQNLLQQAREQYHKGLSGAKPQPRVSYLAEALLLGWLSVEKPLHAARQPLVVRLQRLVPGVGSGDSQLEKGQQQVQLLARAELAAAVGDKQSALELLSHFAALHLQHQPCDAGMRWCDLLSGGLAEAARIRVGKLPPGTHLAAAEATMEHARSFRPPGVYTTFLAAWVGARRQLQQLPQEVAGTVVAAVKAAQQQQQEHKQIVLRVQASMQQQRQQQPEEPVQEHQQQPEVPMQERHQQPEAPVQERQQQLEVPMQQCPRRQEQFQQGGKQELSSHKDRQQQQRLRHQQLRQKSQQLRQQESKALASSSGTAGACRLVLLAAASALAGAAAAPLVGWRLGFRGRKAPSTSL